MRVWGQIVSKFWISSEEFLYCLTSKNMCALIWGLAGWFGLGFFYYCYLRKKQINGKMYQEAHSLCLLSGLPGVSFSTTSVLFWMQHVKDEVKGHPYRCLARKNRTKLRLCQREKQLRTWTVLILTGGGVFLDREPDMSWNHCKKTWLCLIAKQGTGGSREDDSGAQR